MLPANTGHSAKVKRGDSDTLSYLAWRKVCREARLAGKIPHDFRRTAVHNLVRAGVPERVAMMITGHKTCDVFERYNIVSAGDLEEAVKRIDEQGAARMVTRTVTIVSMLEQADSPYFSQAPVLQ